jgi:hypothetical protein
VQRRHGHLAEEAPASARLAEPRRINPDFSIASLANLTPYKNSADLDLLADSLRKAGLPADANWVALRDISSQDQRLERISSREIPIQFDLAGRREDSGDP